MNKFLVRPKEITSEETHKGEKSGGRQRRRTTEREAHEKRRKAEKKPMNNDVE